MGEIRAWAAILRAWGGRVERAVFARPINDSLMDFFSCRKYTVYVLVDVFL